MKVSSDFIAGFVVITFILSFVLVIAVFIAKSPTGSISENNVPSSVSEFNGSNTKVLGESVLNNYGEFNVGSKISTYPTPIRKPYVAGSFYPADKDELEKELKSAFRDTSQNEPATNLKIAIVPHAGLKYSGKVGAEVYSRIPHNIKRIIILANSHAQYLDHIAIFNKGSWQTPIGITPVDEAYANYFIDDDLGIKSDLNAFTDHTIEMQVLMLQYALKDKDFKIIPILISKPTKKQEEVLASKLVSLLNDNDTILIVSSDLSHYPNYDDAKQIDSKTIKAILSGSEDTFRSNILEYEQKSIDNLATYACGYESIATALNVAQKLNNLQFTNLKYANSGDVTGDHSRVVGYSAIIATLDSNSASSDSNNEDTSDTTQLKSLNDLSESAKQEALQIARNAIKNALNGLNSTNIKPPQNLELYEPAGAFVTLKENDQLRGCIGHFETDNIKQPLYKVIHNAAIDAAFNDPRFNKLTKDEFDDVKIEISIMTPRRPIDSYKNIKLGEQGVIVTNGTHSGTFLPVVARDTGWSLDKFMSELCSQKAHLSPTCYLDPNTKIEVFDTVEFEE